MIIETISVLAARQVESIEKQVRLQGWVRTRRDSKAGFSFIELNDGSCMANIQIIADADLENYESEIKKLTAGCSITVIGEVKESGVKGKPRKSEQSQLKCMAGPTLNNILYKKSDIPLKN